MISGVIFDLGMTLIRFIGDWKAAMERGKRSLSAYLLRHEYRIDADRFMRAFGAQLEADQKQRLEDHVERPTSELLKHLMAKHGYPRLSEEVIEEALKQFYAESEAYWVPIPSSTKVLSQLREDGYRLGLISNAGDERNVHRLLEKANLDHYFHPLLISAEQGIRKPNVRLFEKVLKIWELEADQVVMVGDTLTEDILGAQNAGIHQIWLKENVDNQENQKLAEEIKPEMIASSLSDIPEMIENWSLE